MSDSKDENKILQDLDESQQEISETWAADAQEELEMWIEEQGIQLRY